MRSSVCLALVALLALTSLVNAQVTLTATGYYDEACTAQATTSVYTDSACVAADAAGAYLPGIKTTGLFVKAWCDPDFGTTSQAQLAYYSDAACTPANVVFVRSQIADGTCLEESKFTCTNDGAGPMPTFPPADFTLVQKCTSSICSTSTCAQYAAKTNMCIEWNSPADREKAVLAYCNGANAAVPQYFGYSGSTCTDATMVFATQLPLDTCKSKTTVVCPSTAVANPTPAPTWPATSDNTFAIMTTDCNDDTCAADECYTTAMKLNTCTSYKGATGTDYSEKWFCGGGNTATTSLTKVQYSGTSCGSPRLAQVLGYGLDTCDDNGALSCAATAATLPSSTVDGWGTVTHYQGTGSDTCTDASIDQKWWMPINTCSANVNEGEAVQLTCAADREGTATYDHYNAEVCTGTHDSFRTQAVKTCGTAVLGENYKLDCGVGAASSLIPSLWIVAAALIAAMVQSKAL